MYYNWYVLITNVSRRNKYKNIPYKIRIGSYDFTYDLERLKLCKFELWYILILIQMGTKFQINSKIVSNKQYKVALVLITKYI